MTNTEITHKLSTTLKPTTNEQNANAAVALLLKQKNNNFEILLVKRAQNPKDTWSGQIALPGGKRDPKDTNLTATVKRETLEETAINLTDNNIIGVLNAVQSTPRKNIKILPFVILLKNEPTITLCPSELEEYMWVPLEKIAASEGMVELSLGRVPAFVLQKAVVWGITYKILKNFFQTLQKITAQ